MDTNETVARLQELKRGQRLWYWDTRQHGGKSWGQHIEEDLGYPYAHLHPVQAKIVELLEEKKILVFQQRAGSHGNFGHFVYWAVGL